MEEWRCWRGVESRMQRGPWRRQSRPREMAELIVCSGSPMSESWRPVCSLWLFCVCLLACYRHMSAHCSPCSCLHERDVIATRNNPRWKVGSSLKSACRYSVRVLVPSRLVPSCASCPPRSQELSCPFPRSRVIHCWTSSALPSQQSYCPSVLGKLSHVRSLQNIRLFHHGLVLGRHSAAPPVSSVP